MNSENTRPGNEDSPRIIEETRQYIRDFDRLAETTKTVRELYDEMLKLHPLHERQCTVDFGARDQGPIARQVAREITG
jgi:hypothetical protein